MGSGSFPLLAALLGLTFYSTFRGFDTVQRYNYQLLYTIGLIFGTCQAVYASYSEDVSLVQAQPSFAALYKPSIAGIE